MDELRDIYDAERQLVEALPKLAEAAENQELRRAFEEHLQETEGHVDKLAKVFRALSEEPQTKVCKAMQGLVEEGETILSEHAGTATLDAALIAAAQKVEHYEIASYGCLCQWAETLEEDEALELLQEILGEEEAADENLTEIAEGVVNQEALDEESDEEGESEAAPRKLEAD